MKEVIFPEQRIAMDDGPGESKGEIQNLSTFFFFLICSVHILKVTRMVFAYLYFGLPLPSPSSACVFLINSSLTKEFLFYFRYYIKV